MYAPDWVARFSITLANFVRFRVGFAGFLFFGLGNVTVNKAACLRDNFEADLLK